MDYDKENSLVYAQGNVEISQGDTVMLADFVLYDQMANLVIARGHISVLEASGNVYFADDLELKDDMKAGVIKQFKARLSDNSLFVAAQANKPDDNKTELKNAVYSPCKVCAGDSDSYPLWQLNADDILIDQEKQKVTYHNAFMELYGVPVLYTPYLSHPTPNADNQTGLLMPSFKQSTNLGSVYRQPVYYTISPDKDLTITPVYTSLEGPLLIGEYRQAFNNGSVLLDGSFTQPQTRDAGGAVNKGQNWRGHLNATGDFAEEGQTFWGFDLHRTSDDTYLRRYDFNDTSLLTSRLYAEKYDFVGDGGRSFAGIQTLKFYGLTAADNNRSAPLVLPLVDFNWQSPRTSYDGRFSLSGNMMSLSRDLGADSRRLSTTAGWKMPYITADGQSIEFGAQLRTDIYSVSNQVLLYSGLNAESLIKDNSVFCNNGEPSVYFFKNDHIYCYDGNVARVLPQASLIWRYPFINNFETGNILIEPVVMFSASPNTENSNKIPNDSNKIPNEDSQVPEFNASNLFDPNRFAGYDRVQTGSQVSYGLRGQAQIYSNKYIDWLVGQNYHSDTDSNFPFSNDPTSHLSDYVGGVSFAYDPVTLTYRTRIDKNSLAMNQNAVDASFNYYPVSLSGSYLKLKNDPTLQNKEEISGATAINLTKKWQWGVAARRDIQLGLMTGVSSSLLYQNECVAILGSLGKEYTKDRDIKPATNFMLTVSFKNLD